jgi:hypothetical protein
MQEFSELQYEVLMDNEGLEERFIPLKNDLEVKLDVNELTSFSFGLN